MKNIRSLRLNPACAGLCLTAGLLLGMDARAMQVASGGRAPSAATSPSTASPGREGVTLDLIPGTVVSVDVPQTTLVLDGQAVRWHPTQLKVFDTATGAVGQVSQLRRGMRIRFALEPGAAAGRRIVLIYLEGQP